MGKTKIKTIEGKDELVEKLKEELGVETKEKIKPEKPEIQKKTGEKKARSKKYLEASKDLDRSKSYPLPEAVELVKKMSFSKFDGILEAHINTIQNMRGFVSLPFASGKKLKILVFEGNDSVMEQINKGKIDFDILITTPKWIPKLATVAKILGPRGLMPNPKNGTITDDPKKAVESFQAGKTEYKTEIKSPIIHMALGKLSQPNEELEANIKTLLATIGKTKIKKVTLSPTMGAGVKLDLASI